MQETTYKKILVISGVILLIFIAMLLIAYTRQSVKEVTSFEECKAAGYPIMETYPEQCTTPDGRVFVAAQNPGIDSWKAIQVNGISFRYPENLSTTYLSSVDWPPSFTFSDSPFSCIEAGEDGERAGRTERRVINGRAYCVTTVTGAAAGSVYRQYAYATEKSGRVLIATFSLRFPQCANYSEAERRICEDEQGVFSVDSLIDRIISTVTFE